MSFLKGYTTGLWSFASKLEIVLRLVLFLVLYIVLTLIHTMISFFSRKEFKILTKFEEYCRYRIFPK